MPLQETTKHTSFFKIETTFGPFWRASRAAPGKLPGSQTVIAAGLLDQAHSSRHSVLVLRRTPPVFLRGPCLGTPVSSTCFFFVHFVHRCGTKTDGETSEQVNKWTSNCDPPVVANCQLRLPFSIRPASPHPNAATVHRSWSFEWSQLPGSVGPVSRCAFQDPPSHSAGCSKSPAGRQLAGYEVLRRLKAKTLPTSVSPPLVTCHMQARCLTLSWSETSLPSFQPPS